MAAQSTYNKPTWEKAGVDLALRPPEVILGTDFNTKVDIWMLGCAVSILFTTFLHRLTYLPQTYQLLTAEPLVPSTITEDDNDQLGWVMAMTRDFIKETIALKSERRDEFFTDDGSSYFHPVPRIYI